MGDAGEGNLEVDDYSSSGEEDGNDAWKAAISSVADGLLGGSSSFFTGSLGATSLKKPTLKTSSPDSDHDDDYNKPQHHQALKHYQIKAQKALDDILEKTLVMVKVVNPTDDEDDDRGSGFSEDGIRLFKDAPVGIAIDRLDELQGPRKKPRILPGEEINEKSKKFKRRVQSIAVDGVDILAAAEDASRKLLAKMEAKEAAAKEAAKRAEERVEELRRIRGEKWLPSIARQMQAMKNSGN
ncbi:hypothetical protein Dimus_014220 [Dionaea muscipula]